MCDNDTIVRWKYQQNMTLEERARRTNDAMLNLHEDMVRAALTQPLFLTSGYIQKIDERPWWRKGMGWLRYKTIGRFREWLHRDCGGDW